MVEKGGTLWPAVYAATRPTLDTGVLDRQIELEVLMTRLHVHEVLVEDSQTASPPAGAVRVDDVDDVVGTADVAEVLTDALAQVHASVACSLYQHELVFRLTFGAKVLGLTDDVFRSVYAQTHQQDPAQGRAFVRTF